MHGHGLLVVTEDDTETNIGNCCGAREFPGKYDSLRKSFTLRRAQSVHSDVIASYREHAEGYRARLDELLNEDCGGRWAHKCRQMYLDLAPQSLQSRVFSMVSSGGGQLYKEVRVKEEDALSLGYRRSDQIERQPVGWLSGAQAIRQGPYEYLKPIKEILDSYDALAINGTIMPAPARRKFATQVQSIPAKFDDAERLIKHARACFAPENIGLLLKIADAKEKDAVRRMLSAIAQLPKTQLDSIEHKQSA